MSGVDPGWGNDVLPLLVSGLGSTVDVIRCQEIFDYSTYEQEESVRDLIGMGRPMAYEPPMLLPSVPTMVWGGQVRLMARALGAELDEIRETVDRRPLESTVKTRTMGVFEAGTQGAIRFEVQGIVGGEPRIVIEHVTRIHASCAPDWPVPPDGAGAHRVIVEGESPDRGDGGGDRRGREQVGGRERHGGRPARRGDRLAGGGRAWTVRRAGRAVAAGGRETGKETAVIIDIPEGQEPIGYVWGDMVPEIGTAAANFSLSVYAHTTLGLREFEAARLRIAQINGCGFCLDWRTDRDGVKVEEGFDEVVAAWRETEVSEAFDERTRLAAEYAERYALDHHGLDEEFWGRMTARYSQEEIVELTMSLGSWLAFGRLNRVLGLDTVCVLPTH